MDPRPLATEMESALRKHIAAAWFPRCLDTERGGYFSHFDRRWRPFGNDIRMLEFQARQTRAAARLALFDPASGDYADSALHGLRYLRDVMWDRAGGGGWYWQTAPDGTPLVAGTKHGHSTSYAVQACALVYQATRDPSALELASEAFTWFDRHAHDEEHGGYHSWLRRDGAVIRVTADVPAGIEAMDPLGHEVGLKDINVQGDWFEALLEAEPVLEQREASVRRAELGRLYLERLTSPGGDTVFVLDPDWTPRSRTEFYGYGFQAAHRLWIAAARYGEPGLRERAEAVLLHALRRSVLMRGFASEGPSGRGRATKQSRVRPNRPWWVQVEALRALATGWANDGRHSAAYGRMVERQWRFIQQELFDQRYGGLFARPATDAGWWRVLPLKRYRWNLRKGDLWKDASHETDSLVASIRLLRSGHGGPDA